MGLKSVVNRHRDEILYVLVDEEEVLIDIDTMDDVKRYLAHKDGGSDVGVWRKIQTENSFYSRSSR